MKIIVSAGGTGGHIYPALAIINKFKEKDKDLEVLYIGTHNRMEKDLIPKYGIKYIPIEIYGISKTNILRDFKNVILIKKAKQKCLNIMKEFKPDVVIGVGGYVTYPVIWAAKKLNIKTFIHEQNSIPGKANKLISKDVDLVGVSFKDSIPYFKNAKKVMYTGNPCSSDALTKPEIKKEKFNIKCDSKLILIVNGSLGSETINNVYKKLLQVVDDEPYEFLYVTGKSFYNDFIKDITYPKNVHIVPFIDGMSGLLKNTDLIISRAGASTISEILALKVPSILIPSPYVANNHQYYNALDLVHLNVSVMLEEKNLNPEKILITIKDIMTTNKYQEMKDNLNKLNMSSSSDIIYNEIMKVCKNG